MDVDRMTTAELRAKLAECGLPVVPVTPSTRSVLVKKLKRVMAAAAGADGPRKAGAGAAAALAKYSSGEESDVDRPPAPPRAKTKMPAPASPPRALRRSTPSPAFAREPEPAPTPAYSSYSYSFSSPTEDLNSIRARLGLAETTVDDVDAPYLSAFSRRLASLEAPKLNGEDRARRPRRDPPARPDLRNSVVSLGIVALGAAFFLVVALAYSAMRADAPPFDASGAGPVCAEGETGDCVPADRVASAVDLLKSLRGELVARAVRARCVDASASPYVDVDAALAALPPNADGRELRDDFRHAVTLVAHNPGRGFAAVDLAPYSSEPFEPLGAGQIPRRPALHAPDPTLPIVCLLERKLYYAAAFASCAIALVAAFYALEKALSSYDGYKKRRDDRVYALVDRIVDYLSGDGDGDGGDSGRPHSVSHVRDALIPPADRAKSTDSWNRAIEYLERNESRVRFELDASEGEEFKTMRWISPRGGVGPRVLRGGEKAWQGQAFETQRGSVNNLAVSPTPCLKIRHMADENDSNPNLKTVVRDAILEKCGPQCKILHIEIDAPTGCVFVKCETPEDAGIVYRNLHGWWYIRNLITVRYLRLERYMDHFPDAPASGPPYLKPSSESTR